MGNVAFDTHEFAKTLEAGGFTVAQADAMVAANRAIFSEALDHTVASKVDINGLRHEISDLRHEISDLRNEVKADINDLRNEVKAEINDLRNEVKAEINGLRNEVKADVNGLRNEMKEELAPMKADLLLLKWMLGVMSAGVISLVLKAFF